MKKKRNKIDVILEQYDQGIKLDIACGESKQGFDWVGIDVQKMPGVDIVHDLEKFPWPLPKESVSMAVASHYVEHINPAKFGFIKFMNEVWRVMKPGGTFAIATPYAGSPGYWQDPTHINPCSEATFWYFDPVHESGYWRFYKPKPWQIKDCYWTPTGNLEVLLVKAREDK